MNSRSTQGAHRYAESNNILPHIPISRCDVETGQRHARPHNKDEVSIAISQYLGWKY